jgi:hypothetical protein
MIQEQVLVLARGAGMQVARTNRWSALGTVAGLIASGIGANWAAMVISAAASPITLLPITGLLVGGLILLALSGPGLPPSGSASWRGQAVVGAIAAVALLGIPCIMPGWRDAVAIISLIVPALAARSLGALLAWRIGIPHADLAPPTWSCTAATCIIAVALMVGAFPALGAAATVLGWGAGVAYGAAIDRWHLPSRSEDAPLTALGTVGLALIAAGTRSRALVEIVTTWPLTALRMSGCALAALLLYRAWRIHRLERMVAAMALSDNRRHDQSPGDR